VFYFRIVGMEGSMRNLAILKAGQGAGVGHLTAQTEIAREAACEALVRARAATAELDDTGDNVDEQAAEARQARLDGYQAQVPA
jgi:hypothetical protein